MTLHVNDGGTWKSATPYVNDGGVWKPVLEVWVNDAGVWKQSYVSVTFDPVAGSYTVDNPTTASWGVSASQPVVWTYTKAAAISASLASGASGSGISFTLNAGVGGTARSGTVNLQATLNGTQVGSWNITMSAGSAV